MLGVACGGDSKRESTGFESASDSDEDFDPSDEELEIDEVRADAICAASVISTPAVLESRLLGVTTLMFWSG